MEEGKKCTRKDGKAINYQGQFRGKRHSRIDLDTYTEMGETMG